MAVSQTSYKGIRGAVAAFLAVGSASILGWEAISGQNPDTFDWALAAMLVVSLKALGFVVKEAIAEVKEIIDSPSKT